MRNQFKNGLLILCLFLAVGCSVKPWDDGGDVDPIDPGKAAKLWVVITESPARLSARPEIEMILNGAPIHDYCKTHCKTGPDGKTPEFRIYFDNQVVGNESKAIQTLFEKAAADSKNKGVEPWVALSNGKKVYSMAVPDGFEQDGKTPKLLSLLQKFGGK